MMLAPTRYIPPSEAFDGSNKESRQEVDGWRVSFRRTLVSFFTNRKCFSVS